MRKVFTLQTPPASEESFDDGIGKVAGFSLHAGVAARADERKKLEWPGRTRVTDTSSRHTRHGESRGKSCPDLSVLEHAAQTEVGHAQTRPRAECRLGRRAGTILFPELHQTGGADQRSQIR